MKTTLLVILLSLAAAAVQASNLADVLAADVAIAQATDAKKAAMQGLTKVERAQVRLAAAKLALVKAQAEAAKKAAPHE